MPDEPEDNGQPEFDSVRSALDAIKLSPLQPEWNKTPDKVIPEHIDQTARAGAGKPITDEEWNGTIKPRLQQLAPGTDPDSQRPEYAKQRDLETSRDKFKDAEESAWGLLQRRGIPFASNVRRLRLEQIYKDATDRFNAGTHTQGDLDNIAAIERTHEIDSELGTVGKLGRAGLGITELVGEAAIGGKAIGAVGKAVPGLGFLAPAAAAPGDAAALAARGGLSLGQAAGQLASFTARTGIQTSLTPSLWMEHAQQLAQEKGGNLTDFENLAPALALGTMQMSIFGSLGNIAPGIKGAGVGQYLRTIGARAAIGVDAQQGIDAIAHATGLSTSYGVIGDALAGKEGQPMQRLFIQAATFAAFGVLHGTAEAGDTMEDVRDALQKMHERGLSRDAAANALAPVFKNLSQALDANPNLSPAEAIAMAEGTRGPLRDFTFSTDPRLEDVLRPLAKQLAKNIPITHQELQGPSPGIEPPLPEAAKPAAEPAAEIPTQDLMDLGKSLGLKIGKTRASAEKAFRDANLDPQDILAGQAKPVAAQPQRAATFQGEQGAEAQETGWEPLPTEPEAQGSLVDSLNAEIRARNAAPGAPGSPQTSAEAKPGQLPLSEKGTPETLKAWAESPEVQLPPFEVGKPPAGEAAPEALSRVERMRQAQQGVQGRPVAPFRPPGAEQAPETPTIQEATPPELRLLLGARKQARGRREAIEGNKEKPSPQEEPGRETGENAEEAGKDRVLRYRTNRFRRVVNDAIDNPTPDKLGDVAESVARLANMAEKRGIDPAELIARELPELKGEFGEDIIKELVTTFGEINDDLNRSIEAAQRVGFDPASFRRGLQQRLQDALARPQAIAEAQGSTPAGGEPATGGAAGAETAAVNPRPAPRGGEGVGRKLTKGEQGRQALEAKKAGREGEHETFGLTKEEWDGLKPLEQQRWRATKNEFLMEENRLALRGARSLYGDVMSRGGLDPEQAASILGKDEFQQWKNESGLPAKLFKRGGAALEDLVAELGRFGVVDPQDTNAAEHFMAKLMEHSLIEESRGADAELARAEQEYINSKLDNIREEVRNEHPEYTTDQVEAEVGKRYSPAQGSTGAGEEGPGAVQEGAAVPGPEEAGFDFGANQPEQFGKPLSEAEKAMGRIGGGQENAGETARPMRETALANAKVDEERVARGDPPLMDAARKTNPDIWDAAMRRLDADPQAAANLVEELTDNPRATTAEENALLLQRKIALGNETERAMRQFLDIAKKRTALTDLTPEQNAEMDRLDKLMNELGEQTNALDQITKQTGTEWGRAGQFRKQLAKEDYSLSSMLNQKTAAKGEPLTAEEKANVLELQKQIEALQAKVDEYEKAGKAAPEEVQAKAERAKDAFQSDLAGLRYARKPPLQRAADTWVKWVRTAILSSPQIIAKLGSAAIERLITTPIEEATGAIIGKLFPGLEGKAVQEARLNVNAEGKALASVWMKGIKDAWQTLTTGKSDLDTLYGKKGDLPRSWLDWMGSFHGMLKAPVKRAAYERAMAKGAALAEANGLDPTDPMVQLRLGTEAYKMAQRSIFMQNNKVVDAYNRSLEYLERPDKATGQPTPGGKTLATAARTLLPVVRVPTNIVAETFNHVFGFATGGYRLFRAYADGIKNLPTEEADQIMRQLKKGSLGGAAMAAGFFLSNQVGGYYQPGEKRKPSDVAAGRIAAPQWLQPVTGKDIPSFLIHNPLLEAVQVGATVRRAMDSKARKTDTEKQGFTVGAFKAVTGLLEEVPFIREAKEVTEGLRNPAEAAGKEVRTLAVPAAVQFAAKKADYYTDTITGERKPIERKPKGFIQEIETGVPGLRQKVPRK